MTCPVTLFPTGGAEQAEQEEAPSPSARTGLWFDARKLCKGDFCDSIEDVVQKLLELRSCAEVPPFCLWHKQVPTTPFPETQRCCSKGLGRARPLPDGRCVVTTQVLIIDRGHVKATGMKYPHFCTCGSHRASSIGINNLFDYLQPLLHSLDCEVRSRPAAKAMLRRRSTIHTPSQKP